MKKDKLLFILIFVILLIVPIVTFNHEKNAISELDNTYLIEIDSKSLNNSLSTLDSYINQRIGLRNETIEFFQNLNDKVFGNPYVPNMSKGKENETFPGFHENYSYSDYHESFVQAISLMAKDLNNRGIPFYVMIEPEKAEVYPEYLPDNFNYSDEWILTIINRLKQEGVNVIDNVEYLKSVKSDKRLYNKAYDTFHWNDYGGYLGTNNLLNTMSKDFNTITENKLEDFKVEKEVIKYYPNSRYLINDEIENIIVENDLYDMSESERQQVGLSGEFFEFGHYINPKGQENAYPKVLCFAGSYLIRNKDKFIINKSSEYIFIHNYQNIFNIDNYITMFGPDCVIFEVASSLIEDYYFSSENINRYINSHS